MTIKPENRHPIDRQIGLNITRLRKVRGITQVVLAAKLQEPVTHQMMQKYEKGWSRTPASVLAEMAAIFEVPVSELFEGVPLLIGTAATQPTLTIETADHELMRDYLRIGSSSMRKAIRHMVKAMAIEVTNNMKGKGA